MKSKNIKKQSSGLRVMKPKKMFVIGGGGHAKVVINLILESNQFHLDGILDGKLKAGDSVLGIPVLGDDEKISTPEEVSLALGVGMMRASSIRKELYERFSRSGYSFPTLVHPASCIARNVSLAAGVQVMARVTIQPDSKIEVNTILNTGAIVEHDAVIGAHSHISPGAVLGGGVSVGECSLIGLGARILPGVKVGRNVTVGAGAVVVNNIPDGQTVVGIPARSI